MNELNQTLTNAQIQAESIYTKALNYIHIFIYDKTQLTVWEQSLRTLIMVGGFLLLVAALESMSSIAKADLKQK